MLTYEDRLQLNHTLTLSILKFQKLDMFSKEPKQLDNEIFYSL